MKFFKIKKKMENKQQKYINKSSWIVLQAAGLQEHSEITQPEDGIFYCSG